MVEIFHLKMECGVVPGSAIPPPKTRGYVRCLWLMGMRSMVGARVVSAPTGSEVATPLNSREATATHSPRGGNLGKEVVQ